MQRIQPLPTTGVPQPAISPCAGMQRAVAGDIVAPPAVLPSLEEAVSLAHNARRFAESPRRSDDDITRAVDALLREAPFALMDDGRELPALVAAGMVRHRSRESMESVLNKRLRFLRLESLHRLLCGDMSPSAVVTVENGPGEMLHTARVLALLGSCVAIKEPDEVLRKAHHEGSAVSMKSPEDSRDRIIYFEDIATPLHADVVYWIAPSPVMQLPKSWCSSDGGESRTFDEALSEYLGRDVRIGGHLVIQTDSGAYADLPFDARHWKETCRRMIMEPVFPTQYCALWPQCLRILQRIG